MATLRLNWNEASAGEQRKHLIVMQMKMKRIFLVIFRYFLQAFKFIYPKCERVNETCLISFLNLLSTRAPVSLPPEEETMVVVGVCCCCCHSLHVCLPTNISVAQEISLCLLQSVNNCSSSWAVLALDLKERPTPPASAFLVFFHLISQKLWNMYTYIHQCYIN